ncbi:hypothetical protein [Paenibacillus spongiae]|uniref:Uncharacterized protein n=1 Tax=Paenibacillus spongiae TaxID=2909671 RepID=A0ABY5SKP5_9BACL|nr:hypothetical protein [Paenibacillus spongiae]UVI33252.1 hypothetical protein L1F29_16020 [Paenibacillus spongiae]
MKALGYEGPKRMNLRDAATPESGILPFRGEEHTPAAVRQFLKYMKSGLSIGCNVKRWIKTIGQYNGVKFKHEQLGFI